MSFRRSPCQLVTYFSIFFRDAFACYQSAVCKDLSSLGLYWSFSKMLNADRKQIFRVIDALIRNFNAKTQYAV